MSLPSLLLLLALPEVLLLPLLILLILPLLLLLLPSLLMLLLSVDVADVADVGVLVDVVVGVAASCTQEVLTPMVGVGSRLTASTVTWQLT